MAPLRIPQIVASTGDPAFATDLDGTILAWNPAAAQLLGHPENGAVGRKCYQILSGRDDSGNQYCSRNCPLRMMAREQQCVCPTRMRFRNSRGRHVPVRVSTLVLSNNQTDFTILHLLNPERSGMTQPGAAKEEMVPSTQPQITLTRRETEVLTLLAGGYTTENVANSFFISPTTVRNHLQNAFRKLKVHNRLEAVCVARRLGLI